jgi:hypothetical protein
MNLCSIGHVYPVWLDELGHQFYLYRLWTP